MQQIKTILTDPARPTPWWIYVGEAGVERMIECLDYWMTEKKDVRRILPIHQEQTRKHDMARSNPFESMKQMGSSEGYINTAKENRARRHAELEEWLDTAPHDMLAYMGFSTPEKRASLKTNKKMREYVIDLLIDGENDTSFSGRTFKEKEWYQFAGVYFPPPELWDRHPEFSKFRLLYKDKTFSLALQNRVCILLRHK